MNRSVFHFLCHRNREGGDEIVHLIDEFGGRALIFHLDDFGNPPYFWEFWKRQIVQSTHCSVDSVEKTKCLYALLSLLQDAKKEVFENSKHKDFLELKPKSLPYKSH